jgi:hypothetical protein
MTVEALRLGDIVRRPALVTMLAVFQFIGAAILLPVGLMSVVTYVGDGTGEAALGVAFGVICVAFGAANLAGGIGLWNLKPYGRSLQIANACIGLFAVPVGTVISALILYYMWRPGIKALFSDKRAEEFTPAELGEIAEVTKESSAVTVLIAVVVILGTVVVLGVVIAIAAPKLL